MKQIISLAFIALFATQAQARKRIPACIPCEKIALVEDLPNDEALKEGGSHLNLGYLYKEYGIIFIPAWNTDGKYVLTNEGETTYYDITDEELEGIKKKYNLEISSSPLSFWKKIGGKIIYLIVIGLIIYGKFSPDDEEEEEVATE